MLLNDAIQNSINRFDTIPKDNMDGTYSFGREQLKKPQGWVYILYYMVDCDVCGVACVKPKQAFTRYNTIRIHCSTECNNMKAFTYEEFKKGLHKKKMSKGKYIGYNGVDLAVRYKDKYVYYKDYGDKMKFWKIYKGKKDHHSSRSITYSWIKLNCKECNKSYYIFKCNRSTRPGCTQKCRQKLTYKDREKSNSNNYKNPSVHQCDYPTFIDENGERKRCHVHAMELYLGRKMKKGEVIHHIDMLKSEYDIDNLYLCDNSSHQIAHSTMNGLVHILIERSIIGFNKNTGEYYLITKGE